MPRLVGIVGESCHFSYFEAPLFASHNITPFSMSIWCITVHFVGRVLVVGEREIVATAIKLAVQARGHSCATASYPMPMSLASEMDLLVHAAEFGGLAYVNAVTALRPGLPVIVLGHHDGETAVLESLSNGALLHLRRSCSPAEIAAHIDACLRVSMPQQTPFDGVIAMNSAEGTIAVGNLVLHAGPRQVVRHGDHVDLRPKEFDLLLRLAKWAGTVVHRHHLIRDVWGEQWVGSTKTLDVHVNAVRRKLGDHPGRPSCITAVRGVGYRLEPHRC